LKGHVKKKKNRQRKVPSLAPSFQSVPRTAFDLNSVVFFANALLAVGTHTGEEEEEARIYGKVLRARDGSALDAAGPATSQEEASLEREKR
jgi:hypothetical protein